VYVGVKLRGEAAASLLPAAGGAPVVAIVDAVHLATLSPRPLTANVVIIVAAHHPATGRNCGDAIGTIALDKVLLFNVRVAHDNMLDFGGGGGAVGAILRCRCRCD